MGTPSRVSLRGLGGSVRTWWRSEWPSGCVLVRKGQNRGEPLTPGRKLADIRQVEGPGVRQRPPADRDSAEKLVFMDRLVIIQPVKTLLL